MQGNHLASTVFNLRSSDKKTEISDLLIHNRKIISTRSIFIWTRVLVYQYETNTAK